MMSSFSVDPLFIDEVRLLSKRLSDDWDIRLRSSSQYIDDLAQIPNTALVDALNAAQAATIMSRENRPFKSPLEHELPYMRAMAAPGVHGIVTSCHRAWTIDTLAIAISIVRNKSLSGSILDAGCHAGHAGSILAHHIDNPILGIDPVREAIEFGNTHPSRHEHVSLRVDQIPLYGSERFSAIISINSIPQRSKAFEGHISNYGRILDEGGFAIVTSTGWDNIKAGPLNRAMRKANIAYKGAYVVGGFGGANNHEGNKFEARIVVILEKGDHIPLPEMSDLKDQAASDWPNFRDYANSPATLPSEKTQAFYRAHKT